MPRHCRSLLSPKCLPLVIASFAAVMPWSAMAAPAPTLIDASNLSLRDDLAWLADRGVISLRLSTWPLPATVVQAALDNRRSTPASAEDQAALDRVRDALARLRGDIALGWRVNSARHPSIGGDGVARSEQAAYGQWAGSDEDSGLAWRVRATAQGRPVARQSSGVTLDGSYVAAAFSDAVVSFGAIDRWWGPARYASPILGDGAPPIPALTVTRGLDTAPESPWLSWIGRWSYEVSVGRPTGYHPEGASTIGIRLSARPTDHLEIGLSRFIYWGGSGRPRSVGSLRDALLAHSNIDDPATQGPDPSNELAGIDVRWAVPTSWGSWAAYGHFIGEDEADAAPSKLMATAGLQLKHAIGANRVEWTAESTDTRLGRLFDLGNDNRQSAYQHSTFIDGHYHRGLPNGAFIGGAGLVYSLGLAVVPTESPSKLRYEARAWSGKLSQFGFEPLNAAYGVPGKVQGLLLQSSGETGIVRWNLGVSVQRYPASDRRTTGLVAGIEVPLPQQ